MMFKHPNVKLNEKLSENSGTQKPAGKLGMVLQLPLILALSYKTAFSKKLKHLIVIYIYIIHYCWKLV